MINDAIAKLSQTVNHEENLPLDISFTSEKVRIGFSDDEDSNPKINLFKGENISDIFPHFEDKSDHIPFFPNSNINICPQDHIKCDPIISSPKKNSPMVYWAIPLGIIGILGIFYILKKSRKKT